MSTTTEVTTTSTEPPAAVDAIASKPSFGDIPIQCIRASLTNPRKIFDQDHLVALSENIKKLGVAQPILVRPRETDEHGVTFFEIVAGERRYRASKLAGMPTVPAIVRELSDIDALEIQVIENLQRQDLHPLEEAEGFEVLMKEANLTAEQMAGKVDKSKAYVYASLKLCALEEGARKLFYAGDLTKSTALLVARIPDKSLQVKAVKEITKTHYGVMSTRDAAMHIERNYMLSLKKAVFKMTDASLLPAAGDCGGCPKRAGNQPDIFTDVAADVCTDPACFQSKVDAHVMQIKRVAMENGMTVLGGAEAKKICPNSYGRLQAGYAKLTDHNHEDPKGRTYAQILGKKREGVALLESPHDNTLIEVVKLSDIKPLLIEQGIKPAVDMSSAHREKEKAQEALAKQERDYRQRLFDQVHHASLMMNLVDQDLRLIAVKLFNQLPGGTIQLAHVMKLQGWTDETFKYPGRREKEVAAINALSPAQLNQFIRDCVLSHDLAVYNYTSSSKDVPENLLIAADRCKVDAKAIKAEVKAEAKAKADAKKLAADKKAARAVKPGPVATALAADDKTATTAAAPISKPAAKSKKPAPVTTAAAAAKPAPAAADAAAKNKETVAKKPAAKTATPKKPQPAASAPVAGEVASKETTVRAPAEHWPFPSSARLLELAQAEKLAGVDTPTTNQVAA
jgi:ParB/RepB/Spo0J family partition protein